jgi:endonuclease-3 related protein
METNAINNLNNIYQRLLACFGPQHWWPAETPFEVIVGAILTQSAAWANVEKAILNLKKASLLTHSSLRKVPQGELKGLIHSCGYYNMKARKLLSFVKWLHARFEGNLEKMFVEDGQSLRRELLEVYGIGEETADSILLYAGNKPVFVIDAYTRRIVDRLGLPVTGPNYRDYQRLFMSNLDTELTLFNEYHALLVALGKHCCLKFNPRCEMCCLSDLCEYAKGKVKVEIIS